MSTDGPIVEATDAVSLIGLTAVIEGLIRANRLENDDVAAIARHVGAGGSLVGDVLAGLNYRLRIALEEHEREREV